LAAINQTPCQIREVAYVLPSAPCDRCHQPAERYSTTGRIAVDVDLEKPVLLSVVVSVHLCPECHHYFRAQPPFLRPDATYSRRVMLKAIEAVHHDGMAMRHVPARLARDFWVSPSESMVRQWCKSYQAGFDFVADYQRWVISEFSGILCVDEVYQDQLALLLAVDPAAPDGDRLIGYQLVHGSVDARIIESFLFHLSQVGVQPEQVITDGSALYPAVLAKVWPVAAHQLCLFHETRHVTKAAMEVIQAARSALPSPPSQPGRGWRGPLHDHPPTQNPDDPAYQRWQRRHATWQAGIAQVHLLSQQGWSQRAIARQLNISRQTVRKWQKLDPPSKVPADLAEAWNTPKPPSADAMRHAARQAKQEQIRTLSYQGLSYSAIARQVGMHRVTVKRWLLLHAPAQHDPEPESELTPVEVSQANHGTPDDQACKVTALQVDQSTQDQQQSASLTPKPLVPPAPWTSWEEVKQVQEVLHEHRFLLLRRPEHLNTDQQARVAALLASPVPQLRVARSFLLEWYVLWKDEQGNRRALENAKSRYEAWRSNPTYLAEPALRRVLNRMTDARFEHLSPFLRNPRWEATNNGAERTGRAFRHGQAPHFNLRVQASIEGSLVVDICQRKMATHNAPAEHTSCATRGRKRRDPV
jgi:transposase-like protein